MKIGCCINLLATPEDPLSINSIPILAEAGFDYLEIPITVIARASYEDYRKLANTIEHYGIPCEAGCNLFPGDLRVVGENVDYDNVNRWLDVALGRSLSLGVKVVVFGSPAARNVEGDFPREMAAVQYLQALRRISEYMSVKMPVVIEHVCRREGNFLYTLKEGVEFCKACGMDNVKVLADTYHMLVEGESFDDILLAKGMLRHMHTANPDGRVYPRPDDGIDYKKLFDNCKAIGYDGRISVEGYTKDLAKDGPIAIETLRKAMQD